MDASLVDAAICGVKITLGFLKRMFSLAGSFEKTSIAAPAIKLLFKASFKSFSSTIFQRAEFIIYAVDFILL